MVASNRQWTCKPMTAKTIFSMQLKTHMIACTFPEMRRGRNTDIFSGIESQVGDSLNPVLSCAH